MNKTLNASLLGLSLLLAGLPAYASSEAPVKGTASVIAAPSFSTAGAEGAPVFAPQANASVQTGKPSNVAQSSEGYVGPRV
ncbi:hypothetical protein [Elioraea rosea]|uniref:hypothetical protein n=1 Tax=Elioraea rosea TaxID=2492390 RepID=UPI0011856598|nr:hypothetical protein [Elioraea rosea]